MKKLLVVAMVLFATVTTNAQSNFEKRATAITNQIKEVVSIDESEATEIFNLKVEAMKQKSTLEKGDKEGLKTVNQTFFKGVRAILGKERFKAWRDHAKAKQHK
ncbi:hypothetical protein [Wenyingzhuangia sp. IMCC45574]